MTNDADLKNLLAVLAQAAGLASQASQGFQLGEVLSGLQLLQSVQPLVAQAPQLLAEWLGMDSAAQADLVSQVPSVKIPADANVQKVVQDALQSLIALPAVIQPWLALVPVPAAAAV